jgi:hypothetical protein
MLTTHADFCWQESRAVGETRQNSGMRRSESKGTLPYNARTVSKPLRQITYSVLSCKKSRGLLFQSPNAGTN